MKALVYHGPGKRAWEYVSDPVIREPTDAIVRIDSSTICGTDLHILKGDVPEVQPGTILGHEAVGTVVEVGAAVTTVSAGDRVLVSCITSCGRCRFCKEGHYGLCSGGGVLCCSTYARTSVFITRPSGPVPCTLPRSTPMSRAMLSYLMASPVVPSRGIQRLLP